jgi:hypothetical protein
MSRTLYEKRGGRYYPVLEKDVWSGGDLWERGCHLVICEPGTRSIKYRIEPNDAPILAAIHMTSNDLARMIQESSSLNIKSEPMSKEQIEAWNILQTSFGDKKYSIAWPSACEIATKFLELLRNQVN